MLEPFLTETIDSNCPVNLRPACGTCFFSAHGVVLGGCDESPARVSSSDKERVEAFHPPDFVLLNRPTSEKKNTKHIRLFSSSQVVVVVAVVILPPPFRRHPSNRRRSEHRHVENRRSLHRSTIVWLRHRSRRFIIPTSPSFASSSPWLQTEEQPAIFSEQPVNRSAVSTVALSFGILFAWHRPPTWVCQPNTGSLSVSTAASFRLKARLKLGKRVARSSRLVSGSRIISGGRAQSCGCSKSLRSAFFFVHFGGQTALQKDCCSHVDNGRSATILSSARLVRMARPKTFTPVMSLEAYSSIQL